jgi:hypothetical protein
MTPSYVATTTGDSAPKDVVKKTMEVKIRRVKSRNPGNPGRQAAKPRADDIKVKPP